MAKADERTQDETETDHSAAAPEQGAGRAGQLLILTAIFTLVAVIGRVTADADRETLQDTLAAIADNRFFYGLSGAGRLASGVTLAAGAWYLSRAGMIREQSRVLPTLFMISGVLTTVSGFSAILLAGTLPASGETASAIHESMDGFHALTGIAGFSVAGLALIAASIYQYGIGGKPRLFAPISALLGATMQLIWVPGFITLHQLTGSAFFLWLLLAGAMLITGRLGEQRSMFTGRGTE